MPTITTRTTADGAGDLRPGRSDPQRELQLRPGRQPAGAGLQPRWDHQLHLRRPYRLTGVSSDALNESYSYDAAGNRLSAGGVDFTYDAAGRLESRTDGIDYGYDAAGNLFSKTEGSETTIYSWDEQNRLARDRLP